MPNLLLKTLAAAIALLGAPSAALAADGWSVYSNIYFDELLRDPSTEFVIEIREEAMQKTPVWENEDEHPPLSARRAIRLADSLCAKLVRDTGEWKWRLESAKLVPWFPASGRWFWEIQYHAYRDGSYAGPSNDLNLVVLMDGFVVQPTIRKRDADAVSRRPHTQDERRQGKAATKAKSG
jgi:hypothetical protein